MTQCNLPGCRNNVINLLNHIRNCHSHELYSGNNCTVSHCSIFRQILGHSRRDYLFLKAIKELSIRMSEQCKCFRHDFALLLHALNKYQFGSQANDEMRQCTLPNCKIRADHFNHLQKCSAEDCKVSLCREDRKSLKHFKDCKQSDCPLCLSMKQAIKIKQD